MVSSSPRLDFLLPIFKIDIKRLFYVKIITFDNIDKINYAIFFNSLICIVQVVKKWIV